MRERVDDDIVGFDGVGDCGDGSVRARNFLRRIVNHPVCDILDAVEAQQIKSFLGLGKTGAFP